MQEDERRGLLEIYTINSIDWKDAEVRIMVSGADMLLTSVTARIYFSVKNCSSQCLEFTWFIFFIFNIFNIIILVVVVVIV